MATQFLQNCSNVFRDKLHGVITCSMEQSLQREELCFNEVRLLGRRLRTPPQIGDVAR